ncbi:type II secretion system assembly factor GspB [Klebsiella variicola subsp. variicola]|nr:type II secretion system assembly factor GspB [Klebsiella variicola subsp. variicola]
MAPSVTAANAASAGGSCGAFAVNRRRGDRAKNPPSAVKPSAPAAPVMDSDTLPPLRYSAHVYASLPEKRSIVLNGKAWSEGDSPLPNLVVEQIQQDVTIFSFNGTTFTLAALDDWPGGKIDEEPKGE